MNNAIFTIGLALGLAAVLDTASAPAQPVLRRLERGIRERAGEEANPADSAPQPPRPRRAAAASAENARQRVEQGSGYLGAIVDDRKDRGRGVRVLEVRPSGPAANAGLRPNDLIVSAAGARVRQMSDLADALAMFPPGGRLALEILRDGRRQSLTVTLGPHPAVKPPAGELPEPIPPPPGSPQAPTERSISQMPGPPEIPLIAPPPDVPGEPPLAGPTLLTPAAPASRAAEQQTKIEELQRRVEQLEQRNKELEQRIEKLERALAEAAKKP